MEIERTKLLKALTLAKVGIINSNISDQMAHIIFTGDDIVTFKHIVCTHIPFEVDFVENNMPVSVNGKDLLTFVKNTKNDVISISREDESLTFKSGTAKIKLSTLVYSPVTDYISIISNEINEDDSWNELPPNFNQAMNLLSLLTATSNERGTLVCVKVNNDKIYATDGVTASIYRLEHSVGGEFMLNFESAKSIDVFKPTMVKITDNWVHFGNENSEVLSIRKVEGSYPDVDSIQNKILKDTIQIPLEERTIAALKLCSSFSDDKISFNIEGDTIHFSSVSEQNKITDCVTFDKNIGIGSFQVYSKQLIRIYNHFTQMDYSESENLLVFNNELLWHCISVLFLKD